MVPVQAGYASVQYDCYVVLPVKRAGNKLGFLMLGLLIVVDVVVGAIDTDSAGCTGCVQQLS